MWLTDNLSLSYKINISDQGLILLAVTITVSDEVNAAIRLTLTTPIIGIVSCVAFREKGTGEKRAAILFKNEHQQIRITDRNHKMTDLPIHIMISCRNVRDKII